MFALPVTLHAAHSDEHHLLIAANGEKNPGLFVASWDGRTGEVGTPRLAAEMSAPTFIATSGHHGRQRVYVVNEASGADALVEAFAVGDGGATLHPINGRPSGGDGPTHLSVSPDGQFAAVANYGGGSISMLRIAADGALGESVARLEFKGSGPRQEQGSPHPHSVRFVSDGRFLLVNDLGLDRISIYRVGARTGELTPGDPPFWTSAPGSGPRHIAIHPNGRWIYSVNELDATINVLQWDAKLGHLIPRSKVTTAPEGATSGAVLPGEIQISRDGRFLYAGNRVGSETIAVFSIQDAGASLRLDQMASNGGVNTRHLILDPTGRWMLLSNVGSNELVVLERDRATGRLSSPVHRYPIDHPMCTAFL